MAFTAQEIATRAGDILQDASATRWPNTEILRWVNDAQIAVVTLVPRANTLTQNVTCVEGARQTIPSASLRLMLVNRNMGTDGSTPGKAVTLVSKRELDAFRPEWIYDKKKAVTDHFMFDERDPKVFWVYPPAQTQRLEVVTSELPAALTQISNNVNLADEYRPAVLEYVLYRAFQKETEANFQARATAHYRAFQEALAGKVAGDGVEPDKTRVG